MFLENESCHQNLKNIPKSYKKSVNEDNVVKSPEWVCNDDCKNLSKYHCEVCKGIMKSVQGMHLDKSFNSLPNTIQQKMSNLKYACNQNKNAIKNKTKKMEQLKKEIKAWDDEIQTLMHKFQLKHDTMNAVVHEVSQIDNEISSNYAQNDIKQNITPFTIFSMPLFSLNNIYYFYILIVLFFVFLLMLFYYLYISFKDVKIKDYISEE